MFCRMCGNELNEGDVFCPQCGTKVLTGENETNPAANSQQISDQAGRSTVGHAPLQGVADVTKRLPKNINLEFQVLGRKLGLLLPALLCILNGLLFLGPYYQVWSYKVNFFKLSSLLKSLDVETGSSLVAMAIIMVLAAMILALAAGIYVLAVNHRHKLLTAACGTTLGAGLVIIISGFIFKGELGDLVGELSGLVDFNVTLIPYVIIILSVLALVTDHLAGKIRIGGSESTAEKEADDEK